MSRTLQDLDRRIAAGHRSQTIEALRDEMRGEYSARLIDPAVAAGAPAAQRPAGAGVVGGVLSSPTGTARPPSPAAVPPPPQSQPSSWSAFFAEQSIAIIAYTGAFLLLVATLIFEVGGWQALNATGRLAIVLVVYANFGAAGLALFPRARLRTVSQAYLGVFALLTPLVGLAVYQDALRPFILTTVALSALGLGWTRVARTVWPGVAAQDRALAIQWVSLATIALEIQAVIAVGGVVSFR